MKWSCEKFFLYIHGNDFEICTDHKPLITVLGPNSKPPSARIERWMLYMQPFKYSIRNIPGRENAADTLSRLPIDSSPDAAIKQTEEYACTIVADAIPAALAPRQVERESERDPTLDLVRHAITSGDWSNPIKSWGRTEMQLLLRVVVVDPGTEKAATQTEHPVPSVTTDTPKEGVTFEQDSGDAIQ